MSSKTVTCKSSDQEISCRVDGIGDNDTIRRVALDKVMSDVACMYSPDSDLKGKKGDPGLYGWTDQCVWVARGCSARFRVCYNGKVLQVHLFIIYSQTKVKHHLNIFRNDQ